MASSYNLNFINITQVCIMNGKGSIKPRNSRDYSSQESDHHVWDRAGMLNRLMGDKQLVETVMERFVQEIPGRIKLLENCLGKSDLEEADRLAHSLKGSCANVHAGIMSSRIKELERALESGDLQKALGVVRKLEDAFQLLKQAAEKTRPDRDE